MGLNKGSFAAAAITALAAVLGVIGLVRHELWRDEAYTWLVLRASHSLPELFANLGFNGHPRLYYVLSYGLTRLAPSMWALRIANLVVALAAIHVFAAKAPFTWLQKLLFGGGFFPLYQYGVVARSYALLLLLLFLYCWLRAERPQWLGARLWVLAALAQVHLFSTTAAGLLLLFDAEPVVRAQAPRQRRWAWLGCAGVLASLLLALVQLWPPAGHGHLYVPGQLPDVVRFVANGLVPSFDGFPPESVQRPLAVALWLATWLALGRSYRALLLYALLTLALTAMLATVYEGHRWHHGFYFVFFIVAAWQTRGRLERGLPAVIIGVLFFLHAALGLRALVRDAVAPYSNGAAVADALDRQGLAEQPLLGIAVLPGCAMRWEIDQLQPVMAHLPDKAAFDPRANRFEPFWRHYEDPGYFPAMAQEVFLSELQRTAATLGQDVVVVAIELPGPSAECPLPAPFEKVANFLRATDYGERYTVYRYRRP